MFIHYMICKPSHPQCSIPFPASNIFHLVQCDYFLFSFQYLLLLKCFHSIECRIFTMLFCDILRKSIAAVVEKKERKNRESGYEKRYWFHGNSKNTDYLFLLCCCFCSQNYHYNKIGNIWKHRCNRIFIKKKTNNNEVTFNVNERLWRSLTMNTNF